MGCLDQIPNRSAAFIHQFRKLSYTLQVYNTNYQQVLPKCHLQNQLMLSEDVQWVADLKSPSKAALR